MIDEFRRSIDITFDDGTVRTVLLNHNAKIEAESALRDADGAPMPWYRLINLAGVGPLRAILWAGLRGADKSLRVGLGQLTLEQAGELLEQIDLDELAAQLYIASVAADRQTTPEILKNARAAAAESVAARKAMASPSSDAMPSGPADSATETSSS